VKISNNLRSNLMPCVPSGTTRCTRGKSRSNVSGRAATGRIVGHRGKHFKLGSEAPAIPGRRTTALIAIIVLANGLVTTQPRAQSRAARFLQMQWAAYFWLAGATKAVWRGGTAISEGSMPAGRATRMNAMFISSQI